MYNPNGSIFTMDSLFLQTDESVIYGHNHRNGIMFSKLEEYLNKSFFDKHRLIYIYTPDKNYKAKIFSCYSINIFVEENNLKGLSFNEKIEYYKDKSKFKINDKESILKTIKLTTCSYLNTLKRPTDERYFIIANIKGEIKRNVQEDI